MPRIRAANRCEQGCIAAERNAAVTLLQGRLGTTIAQTAIQPPTAVDLPSAAFDQWIEFSIRPKASAPVTSKTCPRSNKTWGEQTLDRCTAAKPPDDTTRTTALRRNNGVRCAASSGWSKPCKTAIRK